MFMHKKIKHRKILLMHYKNGLIMHQELNYQKLIMEVNLREHKLMDDNEITLKLFN